MEWSEIAQNHSPVKIEPKLKKKECSCINPVVKEKSFNEDLELDYDKIGHVYRFHDQLLDGVTNYISKFYKPFQIDTIAKSCAKLWKVSPQEVADLWANNGEVTSKFGTAIHDAMEYYEKYQELGAKISAIKGDEDNYALPKHPVLRQIVKDFVSINTIQGKVLTEVLITDVLNGIAGRADRVVIIDQEKKICRVGDYKINVDAEKSESKYKIEGFEDLPHNKVTKYQIQISVYANMLQRHGWTVEGLDVYIYEDKWTYHPLEVLQVLDK